MRGYSAMSVLPGDRGRGLRGTSRDLVDDPVERLDREVLVELVVDLHHRRLAAGGQALGGLERELAVLAGLVQAASEALLQVPLQLPPAPQVTRQRATDPDHVRSDLL